MTIFLDIYKNKIELPPNEKIFWRISAYTIVVNDNKILLVKPKYDTTKWTLPGGGVETHESIAEGIQRECYEETGYKIKVDKIHPIYVGESNFYNDKKFFHSIVLIYKANLLSEKQNKEIINSIEIDEIDTVEWVSLEEINKKNCHHIFLPVIENLKKGRHIA